MFFEFRASAKSAPQILNRVRPTHVSTGQRHGVCGQKLSRQVNLPVVLKKINGGRGKWNDLPDQENGDHLQN